ncbi:MAG: hypothetical protein KQH63_16165 [Desulfobulbaceae bacterium]|nr:hypothetical protein [Desulfobulbaceae bacterium]
MNFIKNDRHSYFRCQREKNIREKLLLPILLYVMAITKFTHGVSLIFFLITTETQPVLLQVCNALIIQKKYCLHKSDNLAKSPEADHPPTQYQQVTHVPAAVERVFTKPSKVIPAKAGIQSSWLVRIDSRFRGNDI